MGLIEGTTSYDAFGDVDFVIEAAPEKMEIKQAGLRRARRGHARPRDPRLQHLVAVDHRDGRRDPAAREGRRLPLLLPGVGDAAGRDHRGRGHRPGGRSRPPTTSPRRSASSRSPAARSPASSSTGSSTRRSARSGARRRSRGSRSRRSTRPSRAANVAPMGPFFLVDLLGLDTIFHVAEHLRESYGDSFYVHEGMQKLVAEGKLGAKTGGERLLRERRAADRRRRRARRRGARRADEARRRVVESCLVLEEGVCTVRDIDLGMMAGAGMDPRRGIFPPFMGADMLGLDVVLEKLEARRGGARRALRAADGAEAARRPGPARHEERPGLLRLPAGRRGRPDRHGQARDARRRRDRLARQPADERDLAAGDQGPRHRLGAGQGARTRSARW